MGEVYLARDRDLPRPVALKLLAPGKADDPEVRARFLREADTAARLSHPNIVAVYTRGNDEHRLWMAMQYVEGTDVSAVLRDGPLRPDHAVRIIGETARALDFAHRAGVLHRDVKPANILLAWGPDQRVYLADFGIAKAVDHTSALTRTGEMYASFQYAAPEQFELRTDTDHRADVYALGCTLFHMLTGQLPYPGESTAQLVAAHLAGEIPRPSQVNPAVPPAFDHVIERALAKNRDQRFASCGELAATAAEALTATTGSSSPWHQSPAPAQPLNAGAPGLDRSGFTGDTTRPSIPTQSGALPTQVNTQRPPQQYPIHPASGPHPVDAIPTQPPQPAPPRRGRKRLIAAFVVALALAGGLGIGFGTGAIHFGATIGDTSIAQPPVAGDASKAAATKAACDYGQLMNTYDYSNGDAWQTKVEDDATGSWKSQLQTLLPPVRLLLESGTHTRATGGKCTVTSGSAAHYELTGVFDLVDTVNGKDANQRTQTIPMAMDYVGGRWLCSKMEIPGLGS
ncbi:protein kinase [Nocardia sp. ET3-3]|uniref:non-specific serine/threonine protein kinase n=2 Tax=Nocardia terrae TaxID=2675851 RepID=A0A7K1V1P1_9NOCA|nr:protein kinase [Nocardia terrae]